LLGIILAAVTVTVLCANLVFGFISFVPKGKKIPLPVVTFYTTESDPYQTKSDAMEAAVIIRRDGGSGYLRAAGAGWTVVRDLDTKMPERGKKYTTRRTKIKISKHEHRILVTNLLGTFNTTFNTLCGYISKFEGGQGTQGEIAGLARLAYNNLTDMVGEFETLQSIAINAHYDKLLTYLARQLYGLNLIWLEGSNANFLSVLKNAASWIIFSYLDLTNAI